MNSDYDINMRHLGEDLRELVQGIRGMHRNGRTQEAIQAFNQHLVHLGQYAAIHELRDELSGQGNRPAMSRLQANAGRPVQSEGDAIFGAESPLERANRMAASYFVEGSSSEPESFAERTGTQPPPRSPNFTPKDAPAPLSDFERFHRDYAAAQRADDRFQDGGEVRPTAPTHLFVRGISRAEIAKEKAYDEQFGAVQL